jgi:hypothetical protein
MLDYSLEDRWLTIDLCIYQNKDFGAKILMQTQSGQCVNYQLSIDCLSFFLRYNPIEAPTKLPMNVKGSGALVIRAEKLTGNSLPGLKFSKPDTIGCSEKTSRYPGVGKKLA